MLLLHLSVALTSEALRVHPSPVLIELNLFPDVMCEHLLPLFPASLCKNQLLESRVTAMLYLPIFAAPFAPKRWRRRCPKYRTFLNDWQGGRHRRRLRPVSLWVHKHSMWYNSNMVVAVHSHPLSSTQPGVQGGQPGLHQGKYAS